jgi:hypothetical protein
VPSVSITSQHFAKRRSLATGVVMSGSSAGATVFPISRSYIFKSQHTTDSSQCSSNFLFQRLNPADLRAVI